MAEYGIEPGDTCNRSGCKGTLDTTEPDGCYCHICPPCSACTSVRVWCQTCGWDEMNDKDDAEKPAGIDFLRITREVAF